jgi:outer membrane biosynthesis protein TonB
MKASLGTSLVLHTVALGFALVSLGTPASFDVADVEALPVDIIPVESITQIQQGDKKAPLAETSAPVPTTKPNIVENAENAGDNEVDLKAPPTPTQRPIETEVAAAPEKTDNPLPNPTTETNTIKEIVPEETAPKPTEVAALPETKPEIAPEPTPEATPEPVPEAAVAEEIPLPETVPVPAARPRPEPPKEQAKPAETPAEKKPETPKAAEKPSDKKVADKKQETAKSTSSKDSDFNADEIAALLNKQEASGGGAKRSTETAALGGKKTTSGSTLSQGEMDALRSLISSNWSTFAGIEGLDGMMIKVKMRLDESGAIIGEPEVSSTGGSDTARRTMEASVRRAVLKSAPFQNLPAEKYDAWGELIVNFDPSSMGL